jgi:hydroxymethylbilane synthase
MPIKIRTLKLGTRGSLLARTQSQTVADALQLLHPELRVEFHIVKTSGDQITDRPLHDIGGKGLFVRELELALLNKTIDFAVHSFKDMPVTMPLVEQEQLTIAAVPRREDPRDVFISKKADHLCRLPSSASVATGSLRRRCQILAKCPDLIVEPIRGNIDTRLRKVVAGESDALILALAGLKRSGLFDPGWMFPMDLSDMLPAAGQGALAIQCRKEDTGLISILDGLNDESTKRAVELERMVVKLLNGDCTSPIAAYADIRDEQVQIRVAIGKKRGETPVLTAMANGTLKNAQIMPQQIFKMLLDQNIVKHLHG